MALTFSDAKRIPIEDYLLGLGVEPVNIRGNDYGYKIFSLLIVSGAGKFLPIPVDHFIITQNVDGGLTM